MKMTHRYHFLGGVMARQIREVEGEPLHDPLDGFVEFAPTKDQIEQYMAYKAEMKPGDREPNPPQGAEYRIAYSEAEVTGPTPDEPAKGRATYYMIPIHVTPGEESKFFAEHIRILYGEVARLRHQLDQK